ncbi:MAG: aspartate--ammonia ligase [Erysipelotrichaceae bacterium]|jgi:aspartate--ammonia ligase|nr:aspartate--ammonia ligase [Erysipelotrichaceae bacterium]
MKNLIIPKQYYSRLDLLETQVAIKFVKDTFQVELSKALDLQRVSAPLFVTPESGLNDGLNGYERPVSFDVSSLHKDVEIVQSLAKWKRNALGKYHIEENKGIYTDMNAIRRDEELDTIHSIYVDQWDWEKVITRKQRNKEYLHNVVSNIYRVFKYTAEKTKEKFPKLKGLYLPDEITFVTTSELEAKYPDLDGHDRENAFAKEYKAIFVEEIGWPLNNGKPHDGRASDYDDWKLNGDLLIWDEVLGIALEISSMGIRVDSKSLKAQMEFKAEEGKILSPYHKAILNDALPLSIGGGIGQSRLCMLILEKAHIGEVQASVWSEDDITVLKKNNIILL